MDKTDRILIVDDDPVLRRTSRRVLKQDGYQVIEAPDGETALEIVRQQHPDLVLLDVNMPGMDGFEVCRRIKADPQLTGVFVAIVSGSRIDSKSQVDGLDSGADGYLVRPLPNRELLAHVQSMLRIVHAEQALRLSEENFRTLFERMAQGVVYQDASGAIVKANPAAERILGLSLEQMQGRTSMDPRWHAIHEDGSDYPGEEHPGMKALHQGVEVCDELMGVLNPQDGLQRWISVSAYPHFPSGAEKPEGVFTTIEDITQRRQAYAALDAEKNRARTYLDIAAVMLVALDCDGRITLMNNKGSQILGYGEDDLLGKDWFETCLPERERQEVRASFAQIMQGQTSDLEYYENSVLTKTGEERLIGWFNRVIHDGNGSITGTLSSGEDITERRQAESRINQQIEELRRWQQAMLGREERVLELKREVNALLAASGKKPRYTSVAEEKDG